MGEQALKLKHQHRRRHRVRSRLHGTAQRPRLSVKITSRHIIAQLIDDEAGITLAYASTVGKKTNGSLSDKAAVVGTDLAKLASKHKIQQAVFDRGQRAYHKRLSALADAARQGGLEF